MSIADASIRVVVRTGSGGSFTAGNDLGHATAGSRFALPFVALGLIPEAASA